MQTSLVKLTSLLLLVFLLISPLTIASAYINNQTNKEENIELNIYGGIGFVLEIINNGNEPVSVNYSIEWYRYSTNRLLYWINGTMYNITNSFSNWFLYSHIRSPLMHLNVTMFTENQGIKRTGLVIFILRIFLTEERY